MIDVIVYGAYFTYYHGSSFSRFLTFTVMSLPRVFVILFREFEGTSVVL